MDRADRQRPTAAVEKAVVFLEGVVARCRDTDNPVLPQLDELAVQAGVSRMTIWRAVTVMKDRGVLASGRGRRIVLASYARQQKRASQHRRVSGRTRDQCSRVEREIRHSLSDGQYAADESLPSIKELCRRHGAAYLTVRKALDALVEAGDLIRSGRTYCRPSALTDIPGRSVVLIAFGLGGRLNMVSSRTQDQIRSLESECSRLGLRLVVYSFDMLLEGDSSRSFVHDMRRLRPLGYVLWETGISPEFSRRIIDLVRRLEAPLAVLAESWTGQPISTGARRAPLAWFSLANDPDAGAKMGRFLYELGHRHVAFVSTDHREGDGHSFVRWQGLRSVFEEARQESSVELFPVDLGDDGVPDLTFANAVREAADLLVNPDPGPASSDQQELRRASQEFLAMARTSLTTITEKVGLKEALDEVLTRSHITCWVGDNDVTALACLGHLNRKGIAVPGRISIAGFDDGMRSILAGMTTYNFGGAEMMRAIMAFITRPHQRRPEGPIRVPGRVVPRTTTAPPTAA